MQHVTCYISSMRMCLRITGTHIPSLMAAMSAVCCGWLAVRCNAADV
jgi:hypothetical protein